jgi:steroid 5-alpha reductase family enzyme
MYLPQVNSLAECASWSKTVTPFLHQLSLSHILPLLHGDVSPTTWYLTTNPFITGLFFALALSVVVLIVSEVNQNYSQVDRLWSLLPTVYIVHYTAFAHSKGLPSQRLDTLATFSMLWSVGFRPWLKMVGSWLTA